MDAKALRNLVERVILTKLASQGERFVPAASSNRHIHLSQSDVDMLFAPGYRLTKLRDLSQTGQYVCAETVTIETLKANMTLRVLGPVRKETQAEISIADAFALGLPPVVRMSGDIAGSPGARLRNGGNAIELRQGIIVAARHIHMSIAEASAYGLKDGDMVSLEAQGLRPTVFRDVLVRCDPSFVMEAHIDRDEANAAAIKDGALLKLVLQSRTAEQTDSSDSTPVCADASAVVAPLKLVTEQEVRTANKSGAKRITLTQNAIITPLARDMAREFKIELIKGGGV